MWASNCFRCILLSLTLMGLAQPAFAAGKSDCSSNPSYPAPNDPGLVFYLQRAGNANTVVYTANFDTHGRLDARRPFSVFWRRYAEQGQKRALKFFERQLAFGISYSALPGRPGVYRANLVSYPALEVVVEPEGPRKARAVLSISGKRSRLVCLFVKWRKTIGIIPDILHIDIVGRTLEGNRKVTKRIFR